MIVVGSNIRVIDKSGALIAECVRFVDRTRFSYAGAKLLVVVKKSMRVRKKKRSVRKSEMHLALVVKQRGSVTRNMGYSVYFPSTAIILLKRGDDSPMSNRLTGSVSKDLRFRDGFARVLSMAYDVF